MPSTRLFIQNHGSLRTDIRWLVEGEDFRSVLGESHDRCWFDCPTSTLVIDHPDGLFVVDTSCPRDWRRRWEASGADKDSPYSTNDDQQFFDSAIARLGYRLADFDAVIFTHLHFDHAGNAQLFRQLSAPLVAHQREMEAYLSIDGAHGAGYLAEDLAGIAPDRFQLVKGDQELVPGLTLLELPGHTPGTMGVMVELQKSGLVVYSGDAAHMEVSYRGDGRRDPGAWSADAWSDSAARLRDLDGAGVHVLCSHDPQQLRSGWQLAPEYHE